MVVWSLIRLMFFLPSFALGVYLQSTEWLAFFFLCANVLLLFPFQREIARLLGLRLGDVTMKWMPSALSALLMVASLAAVQFYFSGSAVVELLILLTIGMVVYFGAFMCFFPAAARRNLAYVAHFSKKSGII